MLTTSARTLPSPATAGPFPPRPERARLRLSRFAWGVLAYNIAVILWGTVVRATGSGAGCGDHWPLCNGVLIQAHPRMATIIELTHRMTSAITVFAVIALVVFTYRATARRHLARVAAMAALILTFNEALIGALLVLLKLTANNHSPARAFYLSLHLANTLLLLAALALAAHFLSRATAFERGAVHYRHLPLALLGLAATLVVGVSGSLAALGDTLYPAASLHAALLQDLSGQGGWLLRLRLFHPFCALIAGAFIVWLVVRTVFNGARPADLRLSVGVILLLLLQYGLGAADIILLAPVWMQIVHLLGADLLWVSLVVLAARISIQPRAVS